MRKLIKVVATETKYYDLAAQDLDYYSEDGAYNIDQAALADKKWIEDHTIGLGEIEEDTSSDSPESGTEYAFFIVEVKNGDVLTERAPDPNNTARDYNMFPRTEGEEQALADDGDELGANDPRLQ